MDDALRIDLGCGAAKRPGFIGLDYVQGPGVDHVLDLTVEALPFADDSVSEVYSAHFLEHVDAPNHIMGEIGRVCRDQATIEIWTPYAFSHEAFLYGHSRFLTETQWTMFCVSHRDDFIGMMRGHWRLDSITFIVSREVRDELAAYGVALDFAVKYLKGVVSEFGVNITYLTDAPAAVAPPRRFWAGARDGERHELRPEPPAPPPPPRSVVSVARSLVPGFAKPPLRRAAATVRRSR